MIKVSEYMREIVYVLLCFLVCVQTKGQRLQKNYILSVQPVDTTPAFIQNLRLQEQFATATGCLQYAQQLPSMLAAIGYIAASADTIQQDSSGVTVKLFVGEKYTWGSLYADDKTWNVLGTLGYRQSSFNNKPFDPGKVSAVYDQLLDYYQNNGYPFASIHLASVLLQSGLVSAKLQVDSGELYHIDSISIHGKARLTQDFIHRYLDIAPHEIYNEKKLQQIDQRLAELTYLQQSQPWNVMMLGSGAILNLYLEPKQSNQIDVIVGFLPANEQVGGKLLLTGQATINLKNAFSTGETIGVDWQQLQSKSPRLNLLFKRPYLFHSPFGINFNFELYKRDSSFLNIHALFGLDYNFSARQTGTLFLQTNSSRLLSVDTNAVIATKTLPDASDINAVNIGLQYALNNTNYTLNPRSGNEVWLRMSAGNKTITKNNAIISIKDPNFNYNNLYDTVQLKSYQLRVQASAAHYFALGRQAALKTALNGGWYQSPSYYVNELFQIGGYQLLRGFNEESIYADRYAVGTLEYRYLIGQNSYFFVFSDGGWAHYQSFATAFAHTYIGAGLGLAFETKTGIFNISYAIGKQDDTKLDFRQSKIHLGFVSLF
ncbi:hypothetical protein FC093_19420 [Ilyomonas limi]|uniref:POTRA domain-containing protein n=1 Tax=Ilyomonas limi TaxID=2575867 RepID=A0A4U3KT78_9BACT|nr:POTRA domain-containing protein [Ilyomonas limi]TKK65705.1 hypothetical protein FC093_19420 [Ilyomonas limi]